MCGLYSTVNRRRYSFYVPGLFGFGYLSFIKNTPRRSIVKTLLVSDVLTFAGFIKSKHIFGADVLRVEPA